MDGGGEASCPGLRHDELSEVALFNVETYSRRFSTVSGVLGEKCRTTAAINSKRSLEVW